MRRQGWEGRDRIGREGWEGRNGKAGMVWEGYMIYLNVNVENE